MDMRSVDLLGDEIAELSGHLDAATREGWNIGFRSCAAWLAWRVGLDLGDVGWAIDVMHPLAR